MAITKIDITMLEDVSGANNLVKLDANAKIPAGTGANLLNKPGPLTSASDPTVSSNKALGTEWLNTTSGEMYICTDATAGANVWKNVGAGSGDIVPFQSWGSNYGYSMGGSTSGASLINTIDRFSFTSQLNATDVGDCTRTMYLSHGGSSSTTHGYCAGGDDSPSAYAHNVINKVQFVATANATDIGNLTQARYGSAGSFSTTYGYATGGRTSPGEVNTIDKWTFASDSDATDVGDLVATARNFAGHSSSTYGYCSGGVPATNVIQKFSFSSDSNATDIANLVTNKRNNVGTQSSTYGYTTGNYPNSNEIDKFPFATDSDASDVGNILANNDMMTGHSATDYGYITGGRNNQNVIQRVSISSDGNSVDWADLTVSKSIASGSQY